MSDLIGAPRVNGVVDLGAYRTTRTVEAPPQVTQQQQEMTPLHLLMSTAQSVSMLWGLLIEKGVITMDDFEQARNAAAGTPGDAQPQTP